MIQLIAGCMAIHSAISKTKIGIQDVISPYSLAQFLISNAPPMRKRVKKANKSYDSRIVVSRQFDFTKKFKGKFSSWRTFSFIKYFGRNRRIKGLIAINGWDASSIVESTWLSHICSIASKGLICVHVARRREASIQFVRWIFIGQSRSIERSTNRD